MLITYRSRDEPRHSAASHPLSTHTQSVDGGTSQTDLWRQSCSDDSGDQITKFEEGSTENGRDLSERRLHASPMAACGPQRVTGTWTVELFLQTNPRTIVSQHLGLSCLRVSVSRRTGVKSPDRRGSRVRVDNIVANLLNEKVRVFFSRPMKRTLNQL